jgi:hypothetical protein
VAGLVCEVKTADTSSCRLIPSETASRTAASWAIGVDRLKVIPNGMPGFARDGSAIPAPASGCSSCGPMLVMASTSPDWRLPVRTPDSGTTRNSARSR